LPPAFGAVGARPHSRRRQGGDDRRRAAVLPRRTRRRPGTPPARSLGRARCRLTVGPTAATRCRPAGTALRRMTRRCSIEVPRWPRPVRCTPSGRGGSNASCPAALVLRVLAGVGAAGGRVRPCYRPALAGFRPEGRRWMAGPVAGADRLVDWYPDNGGMAVAVLARPGAEWLSGLAAGHSFPVVDRGRCVWPQDPARASPGYIAPAGWRANRPGCSATEAGSV